MSEERQSFPKIKMRIDLNKDKINSIRERRLLQSTDHVEAWMELFGQVLITERIISRDKSKSEVDTEKLKRSISTFRITQAGDF